ncbi:unnamed protein product, partial [Didymodactylos carnosus]
APPSSWIHQTLAIIQPQPVEVKNYKIPLAPEVLRSCLRKTPTFTVREIVKCLFPDQEKLTTLKASDLNHELFEYLKDRFPPPVVVDPCKIKEAITNTGAKARQALGFLVSKVPERSNRVSSRDGSTTTAGDGHNSDQTSLLSPLQPPPSITFVTTDDSNAPLTDSTNTLKNTQSQQKRKKK